MSSAARQAVVPYPDAAGDTYELSTGVCEARFDSRRAFGGEGAADGDVPAVSWLGTGSEQQCLDGAPVVRELEHPCVNGCGGEWKHPAAERDRVVEAPDQLPERARGLADEAATIGTDFIVAAVRERFPGWGTADPTGAPGE